MACGHAMARLGVSWRLLNLDFYSLLESGPPKNDSPKQHFSCCESNALFATVFETSRRRPLINRAPRPKGWSHRLQHIEKHLETTRDPIPNVLEHPTSHTCLSGGSQAARRDPEGVHAVHAHNMVFDVFDRLDQGTNAHHTFMGLEVVDVALPQHYNTSTLSSTIY